MTETQQQSPGLPPNEGLATENLRSFDRLRRSVADRKVAGVAGGLGRHLNVDPTVLRVLFVVLVFFGGAGLVLYGAAWLLVPEEGTERSVVDTSPATRNALLVVAGVLAALLLVGDSWGGFGFPWPLALVAVVLLVVLLNRDRPAAGLGTTPPPGPGTTPPPPGSGSPVHHEHPATTADDGTEETTQMSYTTAPPPAPPVGPWTAPAPAWQPSPPVDRGPLLFGPTLALVALVLGLLGLYDTANPVVDAAYPALALAVVGVMLLVGSVVGRPGGLVLLGVVATVALGVTAAVDDTWSTDTRVARTPVQAADVQDRYEVTAGQVVLDLTAVQDPENLDGRRVALEASAGELVVVVPEGVDVAVEADIRLGGEVEVDGYVENGNGVEVDRLVDGGDDVPQITLDLDLVVGHIEVRQEEAA